jgi:glycoprotein-N-acetylgalactosamine 3-beta-galactosyltransferase
MRNGPKFKLKVFAAVAVIFLVCLQVRMIHLRFLTAEQERTSKFTNFNLPDPSPWVNNNNPTMVSTKKRERDSTSRPLAVDININKSIPDVCQNLSGVLKSHIKIAPPISSNISVLCFIMTHSKYHQGKAMQVFKTWGKKCDKLVIASNIADTSIESIKIDAPATWNGLWTKLQATTKYVWEHYPNYDWYFKADDDTYVIMENLKHFLSQHEHRGNEPLLFGKRLQNPFLVGDWQTDSKWFANKNSFNRDFGRRFRERIPDGTKVIYAHGGPGYVMNRKYFELLANTLQSEDTVVGGDPPEDMAQAMTMLYQGVTPQDARDEQGRERFHPESPKFMFQCPTSWIQGFSLDAMKAGLDCCSPYSISFHHFTKVKRLETILYQCPR